MAKVSLSDAGSSVQFIFKRVEKRAVGTTVLITLTSWHSVEHSVIVTVVKLCSVGNWKYMSFSEIKDMTGRPTGYFGF